MAPHAWDVCKVGFAVEGTIWVIEEGAGHRRYRVAADQLADVCSDGVVVSIECGNIDAEAPTLQVTSTYGQQRIAQCKTAHDVGAPGDTGDMTGCNVAGDVVVLRGV